MTLATHRLIRTGCFDDSKYFLGAKRGLILKRRALVSSLTIVIERKSLRTKGRR